MDYNELSRTLFELVTEGTFIDLHLTLKDHNNTINIGVHKCIVSSGSPYFRKMLTSCKEKNLNNITVEVPNAHIAHDVIMSFYNQQMNSAEWQHILETFICRDFFALENDLSSLADLKVPPEGFDLLLHIGQLTNYHDEIVNVISKNLPLIYDFSQIPDTLYNKIISNPKAYTLTSIDANRVIRKWDSKSDNCIRVSTFEYWDFDHPRKKRGVYVSPKNIIIS